MEQLPERISQVMHEVGSASSKASRSGTGKRPVIDDDSEDSIDGLAGIV